MQNGLDKYPCSDPNYLDVNQNYWLSDIQQNAYPKEPEEPEEPKEPEQAGGGFCYDTGVISRTRDFLQWEKITVIIGITMMLLSCLSVFGSLIATGMVKDDTTKSTLFKVVAFCIICIALPGLISFLAGYISCVSH